MDIFSKKLLMSGDNSKYKGYLVAGTRIYSFKSLGIPEPVDLENTLTNETNTPIMNGNYFIVNNKLYRLNVSSTTQQSGVYTIDSATLVNSTNKWTSISASSPNETYPYFRGIADNKLMKINSSGVASVVSGWDNINLKELTCCFCCIRLG